MPEFDYDAALSGPADSLWTYRIEDCVGCVTGCRLYYRGTCDGRVVSQGNYSLEGFGLAHDFWNLVPRWRTRDGGDLYMAEARMTSLVHYLERLSAENPDKPFNYSSHLGLWQWVVDCGGSLGHPAINSL